MDINKILGVMADSLTKFFAKLSYLDTLYLLGMFIGGVVLILLGYVLLSGKATTRRRANILAKYFEKHYIGSYLDCRSFLRRRKRYLSRRAKDEFGMFLNSNTNINNTEFRSIVLRRGDSNPYIALSIYSVAMVVGAFFVFMKSILSNMGIVESILFNVIPLGMMFVVRFALYLIIKCECNRYRKASRRFTRALSYIKYNNEDRIEINKGIDETIQQPISTKLSAEDVIASLEKNESMLDGDSQQAILESIESVKESLSEVDRLKYDDFLKKVQNS